MWVRACVCVYIVYMYNSLVGSSRHDDEVARLEADGDRALAEPAVRNDFAYKQERG